MNSEQALFIVLPMIAVPLGIGTGAIAAFRRTLSPILWFNAAFAVAAIPLLAWNAAATCAEVEGWHMSQPDQPIGLDQYPFGQAVAIAAELLLLATARLDLQARGPALTRAVSIIGFAANVGASALPLTVVMMLMLWPINRLI